MNAVLTELEPVELLIFQVTPFCNINCSYCYLPHRNLQARISLDTIRSTCEGLQNSGLVASNLCILWHAGEPLAAPPDFYLAAADCIRKCLPSTCVEFSFQTNGTLLDQRWIDAFVRMNAGVGLSCDGPPEFHDMHRRYRSGKPTFSLVKRAAMLIKENNLPLQIICVLTPDSITRPLELFNFFEDLGADSVSFNIEETEGVNLRRAFSMSDQGVFELFLQTYFDLAVKRGKCHAVRELQTGLAWILHAKHDHRNLTTRPLKILSISHTGDVGTFAPELLGMHYGTERLVYANVHMSDWIAHLASNPLLKTVTQEIAAGVALCSNSCECYEFCLGGSPSNKISENGTFRSTQTAACTFYSKAVSRAAAKIVASAVLQ